jgi:hypothetical protein
VTGALRGRRYIRFLGLAVLVVAALLGIGFFPTRRLAGDEGLPAMLVGCLIGLISAGVAAWVLVAANNNTAPTARMQTAFRAMVVRLVVVAVLGLAAVLGGTLAQMPLLFWVATSYVALLPLEVRLAIR